MSLQQLMIAANKLYQSEQAPISLQNYLYCKHDVDESHSILDYLHYLSSNEEDIDLKERCTSYARNVESIRDNRENLHKIISLLDRYFSMYSTCWIIQNCGEDYFIGNTKIQKIAFFTNFKEHMAERHDFGFGEPFLSYHYGPWSLSLQQDIELLRASGFLALREEGQGLKLSPKGKFLASSFEDFIDTIPSGKSFLANLTSSSETISQFGNTQDMLDYFYGEFPIFYEIRDKCIKVSSRVNGQIRISDIVLESLKEGV